MPDKSGWDKRLAKKILRHLAPSCPEATDLPEGIRKDPRYLATMFVLQEDGCIEIRSGGIFRTVSGRLTSQNAHAAAITSRGLEKSKPDWNARATILAVVVTALSTATVAALTLFTWLEPPP